MYRRTYPPRNTPLPENYSGVALMAEEEDQELVEQEETLSEVEVSAPPSDEETKAEQPHTPPEETVAATDEVSLPLPQSFATSDMLLLAIAALMSQNGRGDGELVMILLLLLLGE